MASPISVRPVAAGFADVRSLFPEAGDGLSLLQRRNVSFRQLCARYERTAGALRALEIRNRHHDVEVMHQHRRHLRDLARQLVQALHGENISS